MPPIRLDHSAIALPRIASPPPVLVAGLGGGSSLPRPSGGRAGRIQSGAHLFAGPTRRCACSWTSIRLRLGVRLAQRSA